MPLVLPPPGMPIILNPFVLELRNRNRVVGVQVSHGSSNLLHAVFAAYLREKTEAHTTRAIRERHRLQLRFSKPVQHRHAYWWPRRRVTVVLPYGSLARFLAGQPS